MSFSDLFYIVKLVLSSPEVIGIIVFSIFTLQFLFYVLNYSRKPKKIKEKKSVKKKSTIENSDNE